jgi:hypothetical protein
LVAVVLALAIVPAGASPARSQVDGANTMYLPLLVVTGYTYFPIVRMPGDEPINLITNPSFENTNWFTDLGGNQHPAGWTFYAPTNGQPLPFPTKQQGNDTVPALSGGQGEYVHKHDWQLPTNEQLGAIRGLILNGTLTYKVFSDHIPHALRLSQTLTYTPGRWVKVTGYIVGETQPFQCSSTGVLEDDHFIGSVRLGTVADTRFYNVMKDQHAVPGNERAWNKFSVTAQVPANGQLPLVVIMQSNWGCPVDFFIDHFQAYDAYVP